jgi:hypothetical protein
MIRRVFPLVLGFAIPLLLAGGCAYMPQGLAAQGERELAYILYRSGAISPMTMAQKSGNGPVSSLPVMKWW